MTRPLHSKPGNAPQIVVRLPSELLARLDAVARQRGEQRSQTLRVLLERALDLPELEVSFCERCAVNPCECSEK